MDVGIRGAPARVLSLISAFLAESRNVSGCRQLASQLQTRVFQGWEELGGLRASSGLRGGGGGLLPSPKVHPAEGNVIFPQTAPLLSLGLHSFVGHL